jgi:hypothetical protein
VDYCIPSTAIHILLNASFKINSTDNLWNMNLGQFQIKNRRPTMHLCTTQGFL